jgi:dipeptide transport system substrate-binding protein
MTPLRMARHFSAGLLGVSTLVLSPSVLAQSPKKLVFCAEGSTDFQAPSIHSSSTSQDAMRPIHDRLLRELRGSIRIVPSLAERWEISPDGKTYTFFLKRGVKWHSNAHFKPTREFNADDVVFTLERQWKAAHPYHRVNTSTYVYFQSTGMGQLLQRVKKTDDHTVEIQLKQPSVSFLFNFALMFTAIQSQEYATALLEQGHPERLDHQPIGTGPFELVQYEKGQRIRYRAFEDYWEGRVPLDELVFLIVPDPKDRWKKIQSGECHVMVFPNPDDLPAMRRHPGVTVAQQPGINVSYWALNMDKPPFNDVRVRKAMNMAINKQAIIDELYRDTAIAAVSVIPPTMWSHNDQLKDEPFDPSRAKQLLAQAGYPHGFQTDLWAMSVDRAYNPDPQRMARMIQSDLAKIGVRADIKNVEWKDYSRRLRNGEHQTALHGWNGSTVEPDYFFKNLLACDSAEHGGTNVSRFCHPDFEQLLERARSLPEAEDRIPLYWQAQRIFKEQAPWVPIAHSKQTLVYRNEVLNMKVSPFEGRDFSGLDLQ